MKEKIRALFLVIGLVAIDQISKILVKSNLSNGKTITIIPDVFKLQYHENSGAIWGIMEGRTFFFIIVNIILLAIITYFYFKLPNNKRFKPAKFIMIFLCAGAIGNLIDRIVYNYVVDFLYFELIDFPIFNIADCYVSISVMVMIIFVLFYYKDEDFDVFLAKKKEKIEKNSSDSENIER